MKFTGSEFSRKSLLASVAAVAFSLSPLAPTAFAVVPNDNLTPTDILDDEVDVTGVGMFYRQDGFVCTGTLINPRTVLFAAHCVNDVPEDVWGNGLAASWSFSANALPGFQEWFSNGFQSNPDLFLYNVNQMKYHPGSIARPQGLGFLEADIAMSSLDTPAGNVPTWALLFSPLPAPEFIDPVRGTGYHVDIVGYGRSGNGTSGAFQGIDFRRRAAENMLGALSSLDDRNVFLFGNDPDSPVNPQNLYFFDFDDPIRNDDDPTTFPNFFDFNIHKDDALEREGATAGGDSGGPLILDAANNDLADEDLVLGVLSGGTRFYGGQQFSSYGTQSFYQPLYLYWDWIAANNPYRYAGAVAGDGNWEDADHWQLLTDPAYRIINGSGNVVNGVPTNPGGGLEGSGEEFGSYCFDQFGPDGNEPVFSDCETISGDEPAEEEAASAGQMYSSGGNRLTATELEAIVGKGGPEAAEAVDSNNLTSVSLPGQTSETQPQGGTGRPTGVENAAHANGFSDEPLPAPTLANGLPGATGFIPDNVDPDQDNVVDARYFDVTLSAAGTTTLSSSVEIDRFAITGTGAELYVADGGSLTSLIDINQMAGRLHVDAGGSVLTMGDYLLMSGLLMGDGTITTPFFTNVMGGIAPGEMGGIGTLTIDGNVILSSGSTLLIDLTSSTSDLLHITGDASLGGRIAPGLLNLPQFGNTYTIVTVDGTYTGEFEGGVASFTSGVLFGDLQYLANSVEMTIEAEAFSSFLPTGATDLQQYYAIALDGARSTNYSQLSSLFSVIDYLDPTTLAGAFTDMAANDAIIAGQSALALGEVLTDQLSDRMYDIRSGKSGFTTTASTRAIQVASMDGMSAFAFAADQAASLEGEQETKNYAMKQGYGGFLNVDFFEGDTESALDNRDADFDGFAVSIGLDRSFENGAVIGAFANYGESESDLRTGTSASAAELDGFSFGVYGSMPVMQTAYLDGYASLGNYTIDTRRVASFGGSTFEASASADADAIMAGAEIGRIFEGRDGFTVTPSLALDHMSFDIDDSVETGGPIALTVDGRELTSTLLSGGAMVEWEMDPAGKVHLKMGLDYVYNLENGTDVVTGNLALAPTTSSIALIGPSRDKNWAEFEVGVDFALSEMVSGAVSYKTTAWRDDMDTSILGGSLRVKF